jgi:hypothetical protein
LAIMQSQPERALRLAGAANTVRKEHRVPLAPDEEIALQENVELINQVVPVAARETAWSSGAAMSIEQAIEYALAFDAG